MVKDKVGRLFSEYNRPLRKSFLLVIFFTIYVLVIVSAPYHSLGFSEEILYEENFENTQAQGWVFTRGRWNVSDGVFIGDENSLAWYNVSKWQHALALHIRVCIMEAGSTLRIYYRISDDGGYYMGFHSDGAYLRKEPSFGILSMGEELASYIMEHKEDVWYDIEIVGEREQVKVIENGGRKTYYKDSEPLLNGLIALETLDGSYVKVDDIRVIGPNARAPDLSLRSLRYEIIDEWQLVIIAEVENIGSDVSPETILIAEAPDWSANTSIDELPVDSTTNIVLTLEINDARRGENYHFDIIVDPDERILELRKDNNIGSINISIPSGVSLLPSLFPGVVATGAAGAGTLSGIS